MLPSTWNCTVPVGVPAPGLCTLMVAVKVVVCPNAEGFIDELTVAVVVAGLTVCARIPVVPAKLRLRGRARASLCVRVLFGPKEGSHIRATSVSCQRTRPLASYLGVAGPRRIATKATVRKEAFCGKTPDTEANGLPST